MASKKDKGKGKAAVGASSSATYILDVLPYPIATFDMEDMDNLAENYEQCVQNIISMMERDTDVKFTFTVDGKKIVIPVTPGKNNTPRGQYVIELKKGDIRLFVVANKYQGWFRGIVTQNGERFEIDEAEPKMMSGSASLHTNGIYPDLVCRGYIAGLKLGYHPLHSALYILANLHSGGGEKDVKKRKEAIAIVLLIFFEGPRFLDVFELVKKAFTNGLSIELGIDNQTQIRAWCNHSKDFYSEKGDTRSLTISAETSDNVKRVADKLRIMCRSQWDKWMIPAAVLK